MAMATTTSLLRSSPPQLRTNSSFPSAAFLLPLPSRLRSPIVRCSSSIDSSSDTVPSGESNWRFRRRSIITPSSFVSGIIVFRCLIIAPIVSLIIVSIFLMNVRPPRSPRQTTAGLQLEARRRRLLPSISAGAFPLSTEAPSFHHDCSRTSQQTTGVRRPLDSNSKLNSSSKLDDEGLSRPSRPVPSLPRPGHPVASPRLSRTEDEQDNGLGKGFGNF
ncbi:hypothetical protein LINGRAHAP2_LOCUS13558 [Linum grandiflorum]